MCIWEHRSVNDWYCHIACFKHVNRWQGLLCLKNSRASPSTHFHRKAEITPRRRNFQLFLGFVSNSERLYLCSWFLLILIQTGKASSGAEVPKKTWNKGLPRSIANFGISWLDSDKELIELIICRLPVSGAKIPIWRSSSSTSDGDSYYPLSIRLKGAWSPAQAFPSYLYIRQKKPDIQRNDLRNSDLKAGQYFALRCILQIALLASSCKDSLDRLA